MEKSQILVNAGLAILLALFFVVWKWSRTVRSRSILRDWAARNELQILSFKTEFFTGPFNLIPTHKRFVVFRVHVRDEAGHERSGWVRCGTSWLDPISHQADAMWESRPA